MKGFIRLGALIVLTWATVVAAMSVNKDDFRKAGWRPPRLPGQSPESYRQWMQSLDEGTSKLPRYIDRPRKEESAKAYWERQEANERKLLKKVDAEFEKCIRRKVSHYKATHLKGW